MKFKYQARNKDGELQVGYVESGTKEGAVNLLSSHNLYILSIENETEEKWYEKILRLTRRVGLSDLMVFTRQFATLLESKVPLSDSLKNLYRQTTNVALKEIVYEISEDVASGLSLSQALAKHEKVFSDFYVSMIRSSEATGRIEAGINYLALYLEKQKAWRSKIINALTYPVIIMVIFFGVVILLDVLVLPDLKAVFATSDINLPWFTKAIFGFGDFLIKWWWAILFLFGAVVFYLYEYFKSKEGKLILNEIFLRIPIFGNLFSKMYIARFGDALSILIEGGVPIAQAIQITAHSIGSSVYENVLMDVAEQIRGGDLLSDAILKYPEFFPPLVSQMIGIGEVTGRLGELLSRVAKYYEREVDDVMGRLGELIQPLMMVLVGIFVGVLFASILLPLYNMMESIKI